MDNTLAELAVKITTDTTGFNDGLDKAEKQTEDWGKSLKKTGAIMTGIGAGIVGALALSTKAAADEEAGIIRLQTSLNNVGISYNEVGASLEGWIDAQQQSTAFADDQQREALSSLVILTGDLTKAQGMLTTAMDLARWKNIDLGTASDILTKVYAGNMGALSRYGIVIKEGATATEALAEIQKLAADQAEAYGKSAAGQMELLQNNFGDVTETIGGALIPILSDLLKEVMPIIQSFKVWASENPELLKTIVIVVGALGGLMAVLGPILMILPGIVAALPMVGAALAALTGPVGWIIAAIAALIAIGILVVQNWDAIAAAAKDVWGGIVSFFKGVWNTLISGFESYINVYIDGINSIISLINSIPGINLGTVGRLDLSGIKAYASGGIVTSPQLAMVGEAGPEAIIPLDQMGSGEQIINLFIDGEQVTNVIERRMNNRVRLQEVTGY